MTSVWMLMIFLNHGAVEVPMPNLAVCNRAGMSFKHQSFRSSDIYCIQTVTGELVRVELEGEY